MLKTTSLLMVDTDTDKYYRVIESGNWLILSYDEENKYSTNKEGEIKLWSTLLYNI
jgi:hypothetical protein